MSGYVCITEGCSIGDCDNCKTVRALESWLEEARKERDLYMRAYNEDMAYCADEAASLRSALAEAERDAERYRFLRDNVLGLRAVDGSATPVRDGYPEQLDARVDFARVHSAEPPATCVVHRCWPLEDGR